MYYNGCRDAWVPSYRATSLPRSNFKFLTTPGPEALMFWTSCPPPPQNILRMPLSTISLLHRGLKLQCFGIFNQKWKSSHLNLTIDLVSTSHSMFSGFFFFFCKLKSYFFFVTNISCKTNKDFPQVLSSLKDPKIQSSILLLLLFASPNAYPTVVHKWVTFWKKNP